MILLYICVFTALFLYALHKKITIPFISIIVISCVIKGLMIALSIDVSNFDLESYKKIGEITLSGQSIYPEHAALHHPYFPFFLYFEALAHSLSTYGIDPIIALKILFLLFDTAVAWIIFQLAHKNLHTTLLYAINPVTLLITYVHGQFDVIPVFFFMSSIYMVTQHKETSAMVRLSLAVLTKTWPILFAFPLLRRLKDTQNIVLLFLFPVVAIVIYSFFFQEDPFDIINVVKDYHSLFGHWGISNVFVLATGIDTPHGTRILRILFLIAFTVFAISMRGKNLLHELFVLMIFFYCFTFALGVQYFAWLMPVLIILQPRLWKTLVLSLTVFLSLYYLPWIYYVDNDMPLRLQQAITVSGLFSWGIFLKMFHHQLHVTRFPLILKSHLQAS